MIIPDKAPNVLVTLVNMGNLFEYIPALDFMLKIGFQFKLAGYDWRSNEELAAIMGILTQIGFVDYAEHEDGVKVRISPTFIPI